MSTIVMCSMKEDDVVINESVCVRLWLWTEEHLTGEETAFLKRVSIDNEVIYICIRTFSRRFYPERLTIRPFIRRKRINSTYPFL